MTIQSVHIHKQANKNGWGSITVRASYSGPRIFGWQSRHHSFYTLSRCVDVGLPVQMHAEQILIGGHFVSL